MKRFYFQIGLFIGLVIIFVVSYNNVNAQTQERVILPIIQSTEICPTAETKDRLLQKIGGIEQVPVNTDLDNKIRGLSCEPTDEEISALAEELIATEQRIERNQDYWSNISFYGSSSIILSFVFGVVLSVFLIAKKRKFGLSILAGSALSLILLVVTFYTMTNLGVKVGYDGPPIGQAIILGFSLIAFAVLTVVGFLIDIYLKYIKK